MKPCSNEYATFYLHPGEIHFSTAPARVVTVLGSCVSIIMYHRNLRIGSICHAVMPSLDLAQKSKRPVCNIFQYVDSSVEWMIEQFCRCGVNTVDIEVKLFGGSDLLSAGSQKRNGIAIGKKNIDAAMRIIDHKKLRLKAWHVGGDKGRRLIFFTDTGEVITRLVGKGAANGKHRHGR